MNHFYVRAGGVERPRHRGQLPCDYRWRQGFSRVVGGASTQPWCTLQEARDAAAKEGVRVVVFPTLEQAVASQKAYLSKGQFIRYDLWALVYRSPFEDQDTVSDVAYDLQLALSLLDRLREEEERTARLVHPAQWVVTAWTIHNQKPLGKKPKDGRVCHCAQNHVPVNDKAKSPKVCVRCYGDFEHVDFRRYHDCMRKGSLREYFQKAEQD